MEMEMEQVANELSINGVEYIRKDSVGKADITGDLKIVVLQRGWVMIGRLERNGSECKLYNASVIRCWGTTRGLGEIALEGPKASTKLDKCNGLVEFDYLTVVCSISASEVAWLNKL